LRHLGRGESFRRDFFWGDEQAWAKEGGKEGKWWAGGKIKGTKREVESAPYSHGGKKSLRIHNLGSTTSGTG